jgi:hypothetical protein
MAFGRQIHYGVGLIFLEQSAQRHGLADALLLEGIMRVADRAGQGVEIGGIGELVDIHHPRMGSQQVPHHRGADESGSARDEDGRSLEPHELPPKRSDLVPVRTRDGLQILL